MGMEKNVVFLLLGLFIYPFENGISQEVPLKNNTISIAPLPLIDKTISISYTRKLNKSIDFTLNPRVRIQNKKELDNHFLGLSFDDPYWFYTRYMIRTGILYHYQEYFIEPIFQYDYGFFKKQRFQIEDHEGDLYDRYAILGRNCQSFGLMSLIGIIQETNHMRFKYFVGFGYHIKNYKETQYAIETFYDTYSDLQNKSYKKEVVSFHIGIEIGFRF
jgi:hypothetical protein